MKIDFQKIADNLSIIIPVLVIFFISIFNSSMYIGLIGDGAHCFFEAITSNNFFLGHEGTLTFPYNPRYFTTILSSSFPAIAIQLGLLNIKYLLFLFTFISYIPLAIMLIIIYLNIPKNKKDKFTIVVFSSLTCLIFMIHIVWAENLLASLFIWTIFVIYYYVDFNNLSKLNKISLVFFSFILISSHPMVIIFAPIFLIYAIRKHMNMPDLKKSSHITLILSYALLILAVLINIYFLINQIDDVHDYYKFGILTKVFVMFFISIITIIIISIFKDSKKNKILKYTILSIAYLSVLYTLTFNIPFDTGFKYRILGFYVTFTCLISIICIGYFKIKIQYRYIKILNLLLCLVLLLNTFHYSISWKQRLKTVADRSDSIQLVEIYRILEMYHSLSSQYIFVLLPELFDRTNYLATLKIDRRIKFAKKTIAWSIKERSKALRKFNIDVDVRIGNYDVEELNTSIKGDSKVVGIAVKNIN